MSDIKWSDFISGDVSHHTGKVYALIVVVRPQQCMHRYDITFRVFKHDKTIHDEVVTVSDSYCLNNSTSPLREGKKHAEVQLAIYRMLANE